jgi:hypothetical protein
MWYQLTSTHAHSKKGSGPCGICHNTEMFPEQERQRETKESRHPRRATTAHHVTIVHV